MEALTKDLPDKRPPFFQNHFPETLPFPFHASALGRVATHRHQQEHQGFIKLLLCTA